MRALCTIWLFACVPALFAEDKPKPLPPTDAAEVRQEIRLVENLIPTLRDRGAALFLLAHDYAHLGRLDTATALLRKCISLNEGFDPDGDPGFTSLKGRWDFEKMIGDVHRQYPPVRRAQVAFTVGEKDLIPEGLAVDPTSGVLYLSSLNVRKIVRIDTQGNVSDFVPARRYDIGPVCGLKVDASGSDIWGNTCPDDGVGAEVLHFDQTANLVERFAAPQAGKHLFNDLVLRGKNEIYLTDSLANCVYRLDRRSHHLMEVPLSRHMYYPNGIALSNDDKLYVADAFGILEINLKDNSTQELDPGRWNTLSGADGLYWYRNSLIAVQNSMGSARVAQFRLSPDGVRVTEVHVLESRSHLATLPTTGAIRDGNFYFISNSGVDNFKDNKIVDPSKLEPVRISKLQLKD